MCEMYSVDRLTHDVFILCVLTHSIDKLRQSQSTQTWFTVRQIKARQKNIPWLCDAYTQGLEPVQGTAQKI